MRKYGLIGYPLGHSFSKQYFSEKFIREAITDCVYENFPLKNIRLVKELISEDNEICGLNVTIPFKSEIIKFLDLLDGEADAAGAVNVIKITQKGTLRILKGFNTDIYGFRESIIPFINKATSRALVLGTGGSSKAVAYVLGKLGLELTIISRNPRPGCITYKEITEKVIAENLLIINCTPLGMFPDIGGLPDLNYGLLTDKHILYDLVYNPEMTLFLKAGKERGCKIMGGLGMLHLQAEKAWDIWNDHNI